MSETYDRLSKLRIDREELEQSKFKKIAEKIAVRVSDEEAKSLLTAILSALGGSSNTTPAVYNIALGAVDTEQSLALPSDTMFFLIKTRGNSILKLAYTATESGSKYVTIPKNGVFTDNNFYSSQTIYFQSSQTGDVVEIIAYS